MNFLEKIQNLSAGKKNLIFWSFLVAAAALLILFYFKNAAERLEKFKRSGLEEKINFPNPGPEMEKYFLPPEAATSSETAGATGNNFENKAD